MRRRTLIQTVVASPLAAALPAAAAPPQATTAPKDEFAKLETSASAESASEPLHHWFSSEEFAALEQLAGLLFPAVNGKPGALEAGVPAFLDFLISQSPPAKQKLYRDGLARWMQAADPTALLRPLTERWTYQPPSDPFARFLRESKEDILQATFNSREWIEARSGGRGGAGTYYLTVE